MKLSGHGVRIAFFIFVLAALIGCEQPTSSGGDSTSYVPGIGELTLKNAYVDALDFVYWVDGNGGSHDYGPDAVFDNALNKTVDGMDSGSEATKEVEAGSSPVYFSFATGGDEYRTTAFVTVSNGESIRFELTGGTTVIKAGLSSATVGEAIVLTLAEAAALQR